MLTAHLTFCNEIVKLWLPEGKLSTGHDEAVIDAIPKSGFKEMSLYEATENAKTSS